MEMSARAHESSADFDQKNKKKYHLLSYFADKWLGWSQVGALKQFNNYLLFILSLPF